ncbi:MAG: hypothetical protein R3F62_03190 [Planctomycetota bacterium]
MSSPCARPSPRRAIATQNEGPLHAALKAHLAQPGDRFEVPFAGYQIDLVRDELLLEIQTAKLGALRPKLRALLRERPVRVVYPVLAETWLVSVDAEGRPVRRRKSPKRRGLWDAFAELVSLPRLFRDPRFSCEVLLVQAEEVRRPATRRRRRRKDWVVAERRLLGVGERHLLTGVDGLQALVPAELVGPFGTADLARTLGCPRHLAQKLAYCLREAGALETVGKRGNALLYARSALASSA